MHNDDHFPHPFSHTPCSSTCHPLGCFVTCSTMPRAAVSFSMPASSSMPPEKGERSALDPRRCISIICSSTDHSFAHDTDVRRPLIVIMTISIVVGAAYSFLWFTFDLLWSAALGATTTACWIVALCFLLLADKTLVSLQVFCWGGILGIPLICASFGGGLGSAGILSACYGGPFLLVLFDPNIRRSLVGVLFIFAASIIMAVVEQGLGPHALTPQRGALPPMWYAVCAWINVNVVSTALFVVLLIAVVQLRCNKNELNENESRIENLNRLLMLQTERLQMERKLTHKLIFNTFPENVAGAFVDLFETCAEGCDSIQPADMASLLISTQMIGESKEELGLSASRLEELSSHHPAAVPSTSHLLPPNESYTVFHRSSLGTSTATRSAAENEHVVRMSGLINRDLCPREHRWATILFADLVGFTAMASRLDPKALVSLLDHLFGQMDDLCAEHHVAKVKTIGDCYMCVGWAQEGVSPASSAARVLTVANEMHRIAKSTEFRGKRMAVRAGMHIGPVVSGIIGKTGFAFDIWGDAVNVASRMESTGVPGATQVTADVYELLEDKTAFTKRGVVDVKGKGKLCTYVMVGPEPYSPNAHAGRRPAARRVSNAVEILLTLMMEDMVG